MIRRLTDPPLRTGFGAHLWRSLRTVPVLAALMLSGCFEPTHDAVPQALVDSVHVPGYGLIRFWGDELTPAFVDSVTRQYGQIAANAKAGRAPWMRDKATFLALSGGGDNGAFTAGIAKGWSEDGSRPVFEVVTGVSTGALAAPFVFLGSAYDDDLRDIYTQNGPDELYANNFLFGLFSDSLKNTAPLEKLIRRYATDELLDAIAAQYRAGRRLQVMTTNIDAQRPMIWDLTAIAASGRPDRRDLFVALLLASSAIPGVFPPVKIAVVAPTGQRYDELYVDGGATAEAIFAPPLAKLSELETKVLGKTRARTIYVIRNGKLVPEYARVHMTAIDIAKRGVATLVKYQSLSNLRVLQRAAAGGDAKFFFGAIPGSFDYEKHAAFDPAYAAALFDVGRTFGKAGQWASSPALTPQLESR